MHLYQHLETDLKINLKKVSRQYKTKTKSKVYLSMYKTRKHANTEITDIIKAKMKH